MVKRRALLDSSDSSSVESEASDLDSEFLNLAKKKKTKSKMNRSLTSFSEQSASEIDRRSSSESSHEEFNDGYASDFMGDAEDRANLARMTEKEREQEIFKRIESREVLKTRFNIEKKLRQAKRREMRKLKSIQDEKVERYFNAKERKRYAEEKRDKKHHSSSSSKNRANEKNNRNEKSSSKTKLKASEIYSDDSVSSSDDERTSKRKRKTVNKLSSDSSSDSETGSRKRSTKVQYITTREQLDQIRLSRHKLEQFLSLPFFKRIVIGCFVRLIVGAVNGKTIYKICEITDIKEDSSAYQIGSIKTNKTLHLRYGPHERFIRLQYVSNQQFSDSEFEKWRKTCTSQGTSLPKVDQIQSKLRDIKEAILYGLKEDEIEKIIRRKERFRTNPHNYAIKKNHLMKDKELAQSIGDITKVDEIQDELAELEKKTVEIEKLRTATINNIIYLNSRNRKKNAEEIEKINNEMKTTNKDQKIDDPFTRRHTKPTMVHRKKDSGKEDSIYEMSSTESKYEKNDSFNSIKKINPQKQGEEMYSAHDFDIKIEFDVTPQVHTTAPSNDDKVVKENSSKKSLNLEDYKKRKGLI